MNAMLSQGFVPDKGSCVARIQAVCKEVSTAATNDKQN